MLYNIGYKSLKGGILMSKSQVLQAKLLEAKSREIIEIIRSELKKAGRPKTKIDIKYDEDKEILTYYIEGERAKISCIMKNINAQVAARVKRALCK